MTQMHISNSDIIRYGMTAQAYREHWDGMSEADQEAQGLVDFLGGLTEEERTELEGKKYGKHG